MSSTPAYLELTQPACCRRRYQAFFEGWGLFRDAVCTWSPWWPSLKSRGLPVIQHAQSEAERVEAVPADAPVITAPHLAEPVGRDWRPEGETRCARHQSSRNPGAPRAPGNAAGEELGEASAARCARCSHELRPPSEARQSSERLQIKCCLKRRHQACSALAGPYGAAGSVVAGTRCSAGAGAGGLVGGSWQLPSLRAALLIACRCQMPNYQGR